ncbi:hypothetical protein ACSSV1_000188 [Labrenzia sp. MBR-25]
MTDLLDRKLRFSDVAYAINTTPKSLRNWLQRKQVRLTTHEDSGWREFNLVDVAILAIVRRLVDFGVPVEDASDVANVAVIGYGVTIDREAGRNPAAIRFAYDDLVIWREAGDWKMKLLNYEKEGFPRRDAMLIVSLGMLAEEASRRAWQGSSHDSFEDEDSFLAALEKLTITIKDATPSRHSDCED